MNIIHKLFEIVGASVVLIGCFLILNVCLYDLFTMMDKSKAKRIKRRELKQRREKLFKNNKVA